MVRTAQHARQSTTGIFSHTPRGSSEAGNTTPAPIYTPPMHAPEKHALVRRGRWFRARRPRLLMIPEVLHHLDPNADEEWGMLSLPANLHYNTKRIPACATEECVQEGWVTQQQLNPESPPDGLRHLFSLPEELLLRILRYIVPSGGSFHVVPTGRAIVLDHIAQHVDSAVSFDVEETPCEIPIRPHMTAIARASRELNRLFSSVLYGENHWLFKRTSGGDAWPAIVALAPNVGGVRCWSRLHERDVDQDPCWPLTPSTARFVRSFSLLGTTCQEHTRLTPRQAALQDRVEKVLALFEGPGHGLQNLIVTVVSQHAVSMSGRDWLVCRRVGERLVLGSWVGDEYGVAEDDELGVWEPVRRVKGVEEVRLRGLITEEGARIAEREIMGSGVEERLQTQLLE